VGFNFSDKNPIKRVAQLCNCTMSSTETEPAAAAAETAAASTSPPVEEQAAASKVQQPSKPSTHLEKEEEDTIKPAEPAGKKVEEDQPVETDTVKGTPEVSGEDRLEEPLAEKDPSDPEAKTEEESSESKGGYSLSKEAVEAIAEISDGLKEAFQKQESLLLETEPNHDEVKEEEKAVVENGHPEPAVESEGTLKTEGEVQADSAEPTVVEESNGVVEQSKVEVFQELKEEKAVQDILQEVIQEVEATSGERNEAAVAAAAASLGGSAAAAAGQGIMDSHESLGSSKGSEEAEATSLEAVDTESVPPSAVPEIELIIKASTIDGRRKGACIFCQEYFMDLYLLAEIKAISLKITTVDMKRPPVDFRSNFEAAQPPILIDNMHAILENEKIERHIMKHIPGGHNLFVADPTVEKRLENLYNRFKMMLVRQDDASRRSVVAILRLINETLEEKGTRFLTGDTLCCFDCELMPKLQHIRVAGRFFLDFDIPSEMTHLWKYIREMYELDAFVQSCPADQDIIHIYKMQRMNTLTRRQTKTREELEAPTYLTSLPSNVVI